MQLGRKGFVFTRLERANGEAMESVSAQIANKASGTSSDSNGNGGRRPNDGDSTGAKANGGSGASLVSVGKGSGADQAMETMQYDRVAIAYLSLLLLPLVVGFSVKKLVMDEHAGWYSWALQSLTVGALRVASYAGCSYLLH